MSFTIAKNNTFNSIEINFDGKPPTLPNTTNAKRKRKKKPAQPPQIRLKSKKTQNLKKSPRRNSSPP